MRAIIRVTLRDVTDERAIEVKKAIEKVVEKIADSEIEMTLMAR